MFPIDPELLSALAWLWTRRKPELLWQPALVRLAPVVSLAELVSFAGGHGQFGWRYVVTASARGDRRLPAGQQRSQTPQHLRPHPAFAVRCEPPSTKDQQRSTLQPRALSATLVWLVGVGQTCDGVWRRKPESALNCASWGSPVWEGDAQRAGTPRILWTRAGQASWSRGSTPTLRR